MPKMKKCPTCGQDTRESEPFCPVCGEEYQWYDEMLAGKCRKCESKVVISAEIIQESDDAAKAGD